MQTLKFKDKVKKKCKEFLAITLLSSSLLFSSCDNKDDSIYGNSDYVAIDNDNQNNNEKNDDNNKVPVNDENREENENEKENEEHDEEINDLDEEIPDEFEEVDEDIEIPEEEPPPINTGSKYIPSSDEIEKELENDCFNFVKLAKLIGQYCESSDKIDLETPSGKCYVPYYLMGNRPVKATPSCIFKNHLKDIEDVIKLGYHESAPDLFQGKIDVINIHLMHYYLSQKYILDENIRKVVAYSQDNIPEKYNIPNFANSFEFGGRSYDILNEHSNLAEMNFINSNLNHTINIRLYVNFLEYLEINRFIVLDILKCPEFQNKELTLAVLGFIGPNSIINNDSKYKKYVNGECDEYYEEIKKDFIKEVLNN